MLVREYDIHFQSLFIFLKKSPRVRGLMFSFCHVAAVRDNIWWGKGQIVGLE